MSFLGGTLASPGLDGAVEVGLRPERVRLGPEGHLRGHIIERLFLGSLVQVRVAVGDVVLLAHAQNAPLRTGQEVGVGWDPTDLWVVAA